MARKAVAGAAMAGAAGVFAQTALGAYAPKWLFVPALVMAVAGIGLSRRSLATQVLSRGAAWLVLLPTLGLSVARLWTAGRVDFEVAALAATTATALVLTRPMLHTSEARAAFAPTVFRRWLLGGSIGASAVGLAMAFSALLCGVDDPLLGASFAAGAASLFASSIGVVRMRTWGILLGGLTSIALLVAGLASSSAPILVISALGAAPALLMLVLPILVARWTNAASRVEGSSVAAVHEPTRYRIATSIDSAAEPDEIEELEVLTSARSSSHQAYRPS